MLVGDPACYGRFGFRDISYLSLKGIRRIAPLFLSLGKSRPTSTVKFHESFDATN